MPGTKKHKDIMMRLGIDGMSDDESDNEISTRPVEQVRAPRYHVIHPRWRNETVHGFLHVLDLVYCIVRKIALRRRGAFTRQRQDGMTSWRYSTSENFVPGLPLSTYRESWLVERTQAEIDFEVYPTNDPYTFVHDPDVSR